MSEFEQALDKSDIKLTDAQRDAFDTSAKRKAGCVAVRRFKNHNF